jgi:hypothetical protein
MILGYVSSAILAASGLAGVIIPARIGAALQTDLSPPRAKAEFRVAYGTFVGLGIFALVAGDPTVFRAIGALWLGAAIVRLIAMAWDRPKTDWTFWAYLALEVGLGAAGLLA